MEVELPVLEFRSDGVYLDDRKLNYITRLQIDSDADLSQSVSEVDVTGYKADSSGNLLIDEWGDFEEYNIYKYVVVKGLNDQTEKKR